MHILSWEVVISYSSERVTFCLLQLQHPHRQASPRGRSASVSWNHWCSRCRLVYPTGFLQMHLQPRQPRAMHSYSARVDNPHPTQLPRIVSAQFSSPTKRCCPDTTVDNADINHNRLLELAQAGGTFHYNKWAYISLREAVRAARGGCRARLSIQMIFWFSPNSEWPQPNVQEVIIPPWTFIFYQMRIMKLALILSQGWYSHTMRSWMQTYFC